MNAIVNTMPALPAGVPPLAGANRDAQSALRVAITAYVHRLPIAPSAAAPIIDAALALADDHRYPSVPDQVQAACAAVDPASADTVSWRLPFGLRADLRPAQGPAAVRGAPRLARGAMPAATIAKISLGRGLGAEVRAALARWLGARPAAPAQARSQP